MEPTTSYTFPVQTGGIFTSPGIIIIIIIIIIIMAETAVV